MLVEIRADSSRVAHAAEEAPMDAPELALQSEWVADEEEVVPVRNGRRQLLAAAAIAVAAAWVVGLLWLARATLPTLAPVELAQFVAALATVPALLGVLWLVGLRTSDAEARRFGATAAAMRAEAASLERTIAAMGTTIDAQRQQLAGQVEDLLTRGDTASQRLGALGHDLAGQVAMANRHAASLSNVARNAEQSLATLLDDLPRARAETEGAADLLDRTAAAANDSASTLHARLETLAERGREADRIAGTAAQSLADHLQRMEGTSEAAAARLDTVTAEMSAAVDALLGRTAHAVDQSRQGIAAQGDAMLAMVGAHQAALDSAARESAEALAQRIASVEGAIDRVAARLDDQRTSGDGIVHDLETGLERVENRMATLHHHGVERSQLLAASISALGGSADAMTEALRAGEAMATRTIGTTESLLIALDSAAREIDETLPDAIERLDTKVANSQAVVAAAKPELLALVTAAESTHDAIEAVAGVISEQRRVVEQLSSQLLQTLNEGRTKADALGAMVDETIGRSHRFAEEAAPRLLEALLRVRDTAQQAAEKARETLGAVIPEAALRLEEASSAALRRATSDTVERQIAAVTDATAAAVDASTRATARLAEQVQAIVDQTAIVETRIEDARVEREENDRDTFARRVSLLIESLNSASIDITRTIAPEVSDSAWAAYLKGDRGVFTRRAVRLLDAGEARAIAALYDEDSGFRERVNRYIHDFESMLRAVLAQRDGSPLGVTLLSSDMGKLYVALAQAIERLR
jgi:DNA repair exonuclease SbcCD ATPase subunit